MTQIKPKITVIISVYNGARNLQRCIDSVAGQEYIDKELVIMDGGSTDGTPNILEASDDSISYWESEPDGGIYHAWNKALQHASGDWICFLGADDYLYSSKVLNDMSARLAAAYPKVRVVYGRVEIRDHGGRQVATIGEPWEVARKEFFERMNIPHPGTFQHRSLFEEHGHFDETFRIAGDYELLMRELKERSALFVDTPVSVMQSGGVSDSGKFGLLQIRERFGARRKNGLGGFSVLLWRQALGEVFFGSLNTVAGPGAASVTRRYYRALRDKLAPGRGRSAP
jgi:glycosyltransferase involved in cell wall biosynthesis